jgi:hypothetical protein
VPREGVPFDRAQGVGQQVSKFLALSDRQGVMSRLRGAREEGPMLAPIDPGYD